MYNGWPRTDLFDIVLRQHLIIKDANISPVSVETEVEEEQGWRKIGFCLVGGLIPGSTCCTILGFLRFSIENRVSIDGHGKLKKNRGRL